MTFGSLVGFALLLIRKTGGLLLVMPYLDKSFSSDGQLVW